MALRYVFVQVFGRGRLALSERPKIKEIKKLNNDQCDRVITILGGRGENARQIGLEVESCRMHWDWIKVGKATSFSLAERIELKHAIVTTLTALKSGESVIIHCSAGLHRTGLLAYCVLRSAGMTRNEALEVITKMRKETALALEERYLSEAENLILA